MKKSAVCYRIAALMLSNTRFSEQQISLFEGVWRRVDYPHSDSAERENEAVRIWGNHRDKAFILA